MGGRSGHARTTSYLNEQTYRGRRIMDAYRRVVTNLNPPCFFEMFD